MPKYYNNIKKVIHKIVSTALVLGDNLKTILNNYNRIRFEKIYRTTLQLFKQTKRQIHNVVLGFAQKSVFLFVFQVVFFLESVNSSAFIDKLLFTSKEWMTF